MSDVLVDVTEIYERAKEAARAAVAGAPGCDYGLEDVMPEESWLIVTASRSQFMSLVPVYATLDGCVEALLARKITATDVARVEVSPPQGTAVTADDIRITCSWLAHVLASDVGVDETDRQEMIDLEVSSRRWAGVPGRVTSLVLALVFVSAAAADRGGLS